MDAIFALIFPDGWKIGVVLGILVATIILFAVGAISVDLITLLMLLVLVGTKVLSVQEAFSGFGSEIIVILASIFVLCGAVQETGLLEMLGAKLVSGAKIVCCCCLWSRSVAWPLVDPFPHAGSDALHVFSQTSTA